MVPNCEQFYSAHYGPGSSRNSAADAARAGAARVSSRRQPEGGATRGRHHVTVSDRAVIRIQRCRDRAKRQLCGGRRGERGAESGSLTRGREASAARAERGRRRATERPGIFLLRFGEGFMGPKACETMVNIFRYYIIIWSYITAFLHRPRAGGGSTSRTKKSLR